MASACVATCKANITPQGIDSFILHPKGRVAPVQEAQMTSVLDENVHNVAPRWRWRGPWEGMFDVCQSIVKTLFNDVEFRALDNLAWASFLVASDHVSSLVDRLANLPSLHQTH